MPVVTASTHTTVAVSPITVAGELPLVTYAIGNFGKNLVWSSADVTLLFLMTDLLGISAGTAGTLMLFAVAGDLIFDFAVGAMITRARLTARGYRVLIIAGAAPCAVAFALLYALPWLGDRQFWTLAASLLVFRGAYAVIDVPHNALLPTVAPDSRSRGRASGYRTFFSSVASLFVATILTPLVEHASLVLPVSLARLGLAGGALFCTAMVIAAVPHGMRRAARWTGAVHPRSSRALLPKPDALFAAMTVIAFITGFAMPMFGRMLLYYSTYVLERPGFASKVLAAVTLGQFPGVLLWTWLVRTYEKTTLLAAGHALAVAGMIAFAIANRQPVLLLGSATIIGFGLASVYMLPWALVADAVDFSELRHGDRRETATFAIFLVIIKASGAASIAAIGWFLAALGYQPGAVQPHNMRTGITVLAFAVPMLGGVIATALALSLSIGHRRHAMVVRRLTARRSAASGIKRIARVDAGGNGRRTEKELGF